MADGVCAGVICVGDDGRGQRTGLRAVALAGDTMQCVIAVADGLRGRSGLVGRRRGFLQQIAVRIVRVSNRPGLRVVGR